MVLKLIKQVIKVGEATELYPFTPIEVEAGFRGRPQHDPKLCISCAACVQACPPNALAMETDADRGVQTWSIFYGRCIYCARCEEVCPTGAIQLSHDFELAVMNKADLYDRADYQLATCRCCGAYFAPQKEIEYARALLEQAGYFESVDPAFQTVLEMCPSCRRKTDLQKMIALYQEASE